MYIDINIIDHRLTTNILTTTNGKWPKRSFSNFINHFALENTWNIQNSNNNNLKHIIFMIIFVILEIYTVSWKQNIYIGQKFLKQKKNKKKCSVRNIESFSNVFCINCFYWFCSSLMPLAFSIRSRWCWMEKILLVKWVIQWCVLVWGENLTNFGYIYRDAPSALPKQCSDDLIDSEYFLMTLTLE